MNLHGVLDPHFSDDRFFAIEMQREKRLLVRDDMFIFASHLDFQVLMLYGLGERRLGSSRSWVVGWISHYCEVSLHFSNIHSDEGRFGANECRMGIKIIFPFDLIRYLDRIGTFPLRHFVGEDWSMPRDLKGQQIGEFGFCGSVRSLDHGQEGIYVLLLDGSLFERLTHLIHSHL